MELCETARFLPRKAQSLKSFLVHRQRSYYSLTEECIFHDTQLILLLLFFLMLVCSEDLYATDLGV